MLSHGLWRRFGGEPSMVGETLTLDRRRFKIVGVMPDGFALPEPGVQVWIPWDLSRGRAARSALPGRDRQTEAWSLHRPGGRRAERGRRRARRGVSGYQSWLGRSDSTLHDETVGDIATVLWVLLAAVGLLLLVACANVALLSLMRGLDRSDETAVRLALGASPARLLREFLMESMLLAGLGGALGAGIAAAGLRLLPTITTDLPRLDEVTMDSRAFVFAAALTCLSAVLSGLPQAWRRSRMLPAYGRSLTSPRMTGGSQRHLFRDAMVVSQVAMAVVLMAGSGLLVRSFLHLRGADPGFDPRGVLVAPIFLDSQAYNTRRAHANVLPNVVRRASRRCRASSRRGRDDGADEPARPGLRAPGLAGRYRARQRAPASAASVRMVTPGYFRALGLRLADGRAIDDRDHADIARWC